jgi:hypothetical protein
MDDLLDLRPGDQLTVDAVVVADHADLDESLATGESDPVAKAAGDRLVSGSWVVAEALRARVVKVGADSYANRLAAHARRFSLASSELMRGINLVLRALSWLMVVIAPVLFLRQLQSQSWRLAIRSTVAGLVGMEGLVLLTTLAFLTAAVRLSRRRVLVPGLGRALVKLVVIEAGETGGTQNAGLQALEMGRPVLALQFSSQETPAGNEVLFQKGAIRVTGRQHLSRILEATDSRDDALPLRADQLNLLS